MRRRGGFSLLEVFVAGVLLAAMLAACVQVVRMATGQQRAIQRRHWAAQEMANLMERLYARPWAELTAQRVRDMHPGEETRQVLPGLELRIDVALPPGEPDVKRIIVELRWQGDAGQWERPARLVAWRHRDGQTQ